MRRIVAAIIALLIGLASGLAAGFGIHRQRSTPVVVAIARSRQTDDQLVAARTDLDRELRPYRGKMTAEQLAMLEKQYLERRLLDSTGLPRLSLFYLR